MSVVKDRPDHVLALLGDVLDGLRVDLLARSERARGSDAVVRGLRGSQLRLLSLTPVDGLRVTDLAIRVGMTKQALGEFATVLEERGLVETVRDPADRRVRIIRPTRRGRQAVVATDRLIAAMEADWRERMGAAQWDQLRSLLSAAAAARPVD